MFSLGAELLAWDVRFAYLPAADAILHGQSPYPALDDPIALEPGSTVTDVADRIHHDLGRSFAGARVWGPSARFDGQRVGRDHLVLDGDAVEILR